MNANDQRTQWPGIHHNFPPQTQHANASLPFALPDTPTSMHQPMQLSQDRVQNSNPDANVQRVPAMAIRNGSDEMLALFQRRLNAALAERDNTISHLKGLSADLERRNYDLSDELTRLKLYLETSQNQFKAALANLRRENAHLSAEVSRLKRGTVPERGQQDAVTSANKDASYPSATPAAASSFPAGLPGGALPLTMPLRNQQYAEKMAVDASAMLQIINRLGMAFQGTVSGASQPTLHCLAEWRAHIGDTPIPGTKIRWEASPPSIPATETSASPEMYHALTEEPELIRCTPANGLEVPLTAQGRKPTDQQPGTGTETHPGVGPTVGIEDPSNARSNTQEVVEGDQKMVRTETQHGRLPVQEPAIGLAGASTSTPPSLRDG